ncbi:transmembrane protein, putative [Bodo saltans]|uniref:Transmembrane protein, putative n=1 Tax=Bodo saltans TaxID=75058 RepID=A0A0S4J0J6_BODSA|nr:transmembrane protein, putative [Bodo saltans]|eukprot:CUG06398.1 transmembrane protein, putative [Bodo saltans]
MSGLQRIAEHLRNTVQSSKNRKALSAAACALVVTLAILPWMLGDAQNETSAMQGSPLALVPPITPPVPAKVVATPIPPILTPTPQAAVTSDLQELPQLTPTLFSNALNCWDGVQRTRNHSVARYLTTAKVHKKYGLTNVLLIASSMFAYASMDNRAVTFPKKSPVAMESLIDLDRTEKCLAMANVMLARRDHVDNLDLKQVSAWRLGLHLGSRALAGSSEEANATALLGKHQMNMGLTRHIPIVSYGDFFLRFPFFSLRPIDECFYLSRIVFGRHIEDAALNQLAQLRMENVNRFLALHLRLEADVLKIDKRLRRVKPDEVARFWVASVEPLIKEHSLEGVYICAGALEDSYFKAISSVARVPVIWRTKDAPTTQMQTTGHEDAAVDLLIAQAATVAMSTERSTFLLAILSRRCPMKPRRTTTLERFRNSSLFAWNPAHKSVLRTEIPTTGTLGVYNYRLEWSKSGDTTLSATEHVGCSGPWQGHCFHSLQAPPNFQ